MKTAELTGALLDYWVLQAGGVDLATVIPNGPISPDVIYPISPSTNWAQGGPIIERERFYLEWDEDDYWCAHTPKSATYRGSTPLVAAMRAYVASKFGDEVPDEVPT